MGNYRHSAEVKNRQKCPKDNYFLLELFYFLELPRSLYGGWLGAAIGQKRTLSNPKLDKTSQCLVNIIRYRLVVANDRTWSNWRPFVLRIYMHDLKTITEQFRPVEFSKLGLLLTNFQLGSLNEKLQIIDELVASHALLSVKWEGGWRFNRARRLENISANNVEDFLWPPNALASAGRANMLGQPVMYLADRIETALREIRLDEGEAILAQFSIQPKKNCRVLPIGEMLFINRTGHGRLLKEHGLPLNDFINACAYEEAQAYLLTDAFLNEVISTDIDPYDLSSYLCNALFKKYPDVSVIAYPSAQQLGATNFAVKTENFWNSWGVESVSKFYAEHVAQGFYKMSQRTNVTGIYTSGKLQWGESQKNFRVVSLLHPLWTPST